MKTKRILVVATITLLLTAAVIVLSSYSRGVASAQSTETEAQSELFGGVTLGAALQEKALLGTWRVTITPGPGGPPPSQSLHTYLSGGGLIQSNLTEGDIPGQGTWVRTGHNRFTFTFEKFYPVNPATGQQGVFLFRVQETIRVRGDRYTGVGQGLICNATGGNCISLGCAQTEGQRIRIEGPDCQ